ncbi:MAG: N-acetylneuraminate synthase family protein [Legionella sp.]|nr:N-acetylneuraminate synthase family protein [Legionella sp.]
MSKSDNHFEIQGRKIGLDEPTYFIADIAANHDGELQRAKDLIYLAKEAGADAAKFQHFKADTIVSDVGFSALDGQKSHQGKWKKSVYEVYQDASLNLDWTPHLKETCDEVGITFFTSPYALSLVDSVDPYVPAYKIGSGDITWLEIIEHIAKKNKPYMLATGASTLEDVQRAVETGLKYNSKLALLQCNTNYTASLENFRHIQLNVLKTYQAMYPEMILGLSDHTPGHATVLGAVALGARIIEKHFTDDITRIGPDHAFSMDPKTWKTMVDCTRELENSLGYSVKKVEENEKETVVLQRRAVRLRDDFAEGLVIGREHLTVLRPCPEGAILPYDMSKIIGKKLNRSVKAGEHLRWADLEQV